jgi:hypothetical protein
MVVLPLACLIIGATARTRLDGQIGVLAQAAARAEHVPLSMRVRRAEVKANVGVGHYFMTGLK